MRTIAQVENGKVTEDARTEVNDFVICRTGGQVQTGPFRGMKIETQGRPDYHISPKLLGVYEQELHGAVQSVAGEHYDAIVNVGSAEGYYAVGLARLHPSAPVYAFEFDESLHPILQHNARLNGVADRVNACGPCVATDLLALAKRFPRLFVLCDCEGFELALFSAPGVAAALQHSDLIIECHDSFHEHCTPLVLASLWNTHRIDIVYAGPRNPGGFPWLSRLNELQGWLAVWECRPRAMAWLVCRPR